MNPGRQEARARLSPADQQRVSAQAARWGVSGIALTVWLLAQELDGLEVDVALAMCNLVHLAAGSAGHDPTVRQHPRFGRYTLVWCDDDVWPGGPMALPAVPGKTTATVFLRADQRQLPAQVIDGELAALASDD